MKKTIRLGLLLMCVTGMASAGGLGRDPGWPGGQGGSWNSPRLSAPEIDPASMMSGLTLLMGGLAVVRGRRNIKK